MSRTLRLLYLVMLLATAGLQLIFGEPLSRLWQGPGTWTQGGLPMDLALGFGLGLLTIGLNRITSRYFRWAQTTDAEFQQMLAPVDAQDVFSFAALSALAEEFLFRGFLQPRFGLIATSVAFGLAHLPQRRSLLPWTLAAILMGFAFGALFEWRGSLVAPIVAHFLINYVNLHHILRPRTPEEA